MLQIAAFARAAQLKQVFTAVVSATSVVFLQAKQRLSFVVNDNSSHESNNGSFEKRSGLEMPVKPNYCAPRLPIILCHGLFGFDKLGPSSIPYLQIHYWGGIQEALQKLGAKVVITKVPRTGCIKTRALALHKMLENVCSGGIDVNLLAHSMGGLDCRYLITHLPTEKCTIRSLTTVATPHRGSPFMDWCRDNIGVGEVSQAVVDNALKRLEDQVSHQNSNHEISKNEQFHNNIKPSPPYRENNDNYQRILGEKDVKNVNKENQNQKISYINNHDTSSEGGGTNKKSLFHVNLPNISIPNLNFNISLPNFDFPNINFNLSSIPRTTYSFIHPVTRSLIQALDTPAYSNLTTDYCLEFNRNTPNQPSVAYFSYGAAIDLPIWSPLYFPHQIIKSKEGPNDGLVSIKSAQWGRYVKTAECDHWDLTDRWRIKIGSNFDPVEFYLSIATFLASEGY